MLITEDTPTMKTATAPKKHKKSSATHQLQPGAIAAFAKKHGLDTSPAGTWNAADYIRELRRGK